MRARYFQRIATNGAGEHIGYERLADNYQMFVNATRTGCLPRHGIYSRSGAVCIGSVHPTLDGADYVMYLRDGDEMREYDTFPSFELACERLWSVAEEGQAAAAFWAKRAESEDDASIPF